jgi:hypothetical protein
MAVYCAPYSTHLQGAKFVASGALQFFAKMEIHEEKFAVDKD